jgi:ParB-like chromosome segregation protein Spo0J
MIKEINIKEIKPNPNNPRVLKDDKFKKLVQSLKDFPEMANVRPIVVNTEMIVLGGNMRLRAMQEAGWKKAPVQMVDWSIEKQNEFIIKDNVGFGEWDWDVLANEWNESELTEWGLDIPIFKDTEDELKDLSSEINNLYRIEIVCKDEEHQENTYNKLIEQGYECRLLTL